MGKYKLTPSAERDLDGIWKEIASHDFEAADGVLFHIHHHCKTLADSPRIGRIMEEFSSVLYVFQVSNLGGEAHT